MPNKMNIDKLGEALRGNSAFDEKLYAKYGVKRGLRNPDGTGVLAGITRVSNVHGYVISEDEKTPDEGSLRYRGIDIKEIVKACREEKRFGFEETTNHIVECVACADDCSGTRHD